MALHFRFVLIGNRCLPIACTAFVLLFLVHGIPGRAKPPSDLPAEAAQALPLVPPDYTKVTGHVEYATLPTTEPLLLWKVTAATVVQPDGKQNMVGLGDPAIADGVLYLGDDLGRLFALAAADGTELWRHEHGQRISSTPSVDADHVYFGSKQGITALRRDNGKLVWQHPIKQGANETTPLPVGDRLYSSAYDGNCYCLDCASGKVIWRHDILSDAPADQLGFDGQRARLSDTAARPWGAACDGEIFVQCVFDQSRVIAVDCQTGERKWSFQAKGWTGGAPTIAGDRVYVNSQDKHLYCLDLASGEFLWQFKAASWLAARPAVFDDKVLQPGSQGRLYLLDARRGRLIETFQPDDPQEREGTPYSFPLVAGGMACFASGRTGMLYAVDIASGKLVWQLCPSDKSELFTNPITDGRRIFVVSRRGSDGTGESALFAIGAAE